MKKLISIILLVIIVFSFSSCSNNENAQLYYDYDMTDYIEISDYSKTVDRNSDDYKKMYREFYKDVFSEDLAYSVKKGVVEDGDKVSINYEGRYKGEEFDGGTEYNYSLVVGDGQFIVENFEKSLIGTPVGGEVIFNAVIPDNYHNKSLVGKEVTYTVQILSVTRYADPTDEEAKSHGFESFDDFYKQADDFAIGVCVFNNAYDQMKIKSYPQKETELLIDAAYNGYVKAYAERGTTVEAYVASVDWTMEQFNTHLKDSVQKDFRKMPRDLISYHLLNITDNKLTQNEIFDFSDTLLDKYGIDKNSITDIELERMAVYDKALKVCREMAEVK